jgi:hypothetical protein
MRVILVSSKEPSIQNESVSKASSTTYQAIARADAPLLYEGAVSLHAAARLAPEPTRRAAAVAVAGLAAASRLITSQKRLLDPLILGLQHDRHPLRAQYRRRSDRAFVASAVGTLIIFLILRHYLAILCHGASDTRRASPRTGGKAAMQSTALRDELARDRLLRRRVRVSRDFAFPGSERAPTRSVAERRRPAGRWPKPSPIDPRRPR